MKTVAKKNAKPEISKPKIDEPIPKPKPVLEEVKTPLVEEEVKQTVNETAPSERPQEAVTSTDIEKAQTTDLPSARSENPQSELQDPTLKKKVTFSGVELEGVDPPLSARTHVPVENP